MSNNKRPKDGRKYNKRKGRTKIIANKSLPPAKVNTAKKNRAKMLSAKAIKNVFGSEDGIWDTIAEMGKEGNMKAIEMIMQYQYGKAGEVKESRVKSNKAPIINFNVTPSEQPQIENTIDITEEE